MSAKDDKIQQNIAADDNLKTDWKASEQSIMQYFQTQLIIARLQDNICKEIMKTAHGTFQATYKAPLDLEEIQAKNKPAKPVTVAATMLNAEEQEAINAVPALRNSSRNRTTQRARNQNMQCRYCKFFWHMQHDCHKHRATKAPLVDAKGQVDTKTGVSTIGKPMDEIYAIQYNFK